MSPSGTSPEPTDRPRAFEPARLARADRREALLDAARTLVAAGDLDSVSIESVADRAGVSRPLVYKHFANRSEILTALYLREGDRLHEDLSVDVDAADGIEAKYRALFRGSIRAAKDRGQIFAALRYVADMNTQLRKLQRQRDRRTVAYYAQHTVDELGLPSRSTEAVTAMLLGAIAPAISLWHAQPSEDYAKQLEDAYMSIVTGTLSELARAMPVRRSRAGRRPRASSSRAAPRAR